MGSIVRDWIEAWNRHDGEAVAGCYTEDGVQEDVTLQRVARGRLEIADFVRSIADEFTSDYRFELLSQFETATSYGAEWVMIGTNDRASKSPPLLPATGKPYRFQGASIGTLEGGKIKVNRDYYDMAGVLMQIGLMPVPEAATAS